MENDGILGGNPSDFNWPSSNTISPAAAAAAAAVEMNLESDSGGNGGRQRLGASFLNLNSWGQSSALSSLVSSPTSSSACNNPCSDSIVIRELIGRLGSICSSSSNKSNYHGANDNTSSSSCYATPLSSPPKLNLSMPPFPPPPMGAGVGFVTDPGFAERAARYSCFGAARNYTQPGEPGKLSSSPSLQGRLENDMTMMRMRMMARSGPESAFTTAAHDNALDDSSPLDRIMTPSGGRGNVVRKRKATFSSSSSSSKGGTIGNGARRNPPKASEEEENSNSKRCKSSSSSAEANGEAPKVEQNNGTAEKQNGKGKESNAKPPEPPKQDYIHVRARRGQATDSHSLAERVRREKISERMKFLQDLVPGCNKVTGKAVMLDEIINYVQSLQRQVEFLSMKLATVNPWADVAPTKDMHQPLGPMLPPNSSYALEATANSFSYANQPPGQGPPLQGLMASNAPEAHFDASCLSRPLSMQLPSLDGFTDAAPAPQLGAFWDDDLQSVVQMGFVQSQDANFSSHNFQGAPVPTSHMKIEL